MEFRVRSTGLLKEIARVQEFLEVLPFLEPNLGTRKVFWVLIGLLLKLHAGRGVGKKR